VFDKNLFNNDNFHPELVETVGQRLYNGAYTDAILAGIRYLTDTLRKVGQAEGDGAQLVGQVLGGNAPAFALNKLATVAEKDEQKGVEQLMRGVYMGIRNPRTHETMEDTEDYALRVLILIDLCLQYLDREAQEFDVAGFVNRIYEPHFVANSEYAQALVADIPPNQVLPVFFDAFERRAEGDTDKTRYAFAALYQIMNSDDLQSAAHAIGVSLRGEAEPTNIASLFRLLKPESWALLQDDVRMRMENIIIDACQNGTYDVHSSFTKHGIGSWGNTFGRYFDRKADLAQSLITKLNVSWYAQNFVGKYYMYTLPALISPGQVEDVAQGLAYAAIGNKAKVVRTKLLEVASNYPDPWRDVLKVAVQERKENDPDYADKLLSKLE
jgi:uncharacterized protein (TIGR02391 family)